MIYFFFLEKERKSYEFKTVCQSYIDVISTVTLSASRTILGSKVAIFESDVAQKIFVSNLMFTFHEPCQFIFYKLKRESSLFPFPIYGFFTDTQNEYSLFFFFFTNMDKGIQLMNMKWSRWILFLTKSYLRSKQ